MEIAMRHVFVLTPVARAPTPAFVDSIIRVIGQHSDELRVDWINAVGHANTPRVRNALCHQALKMGADEIVWIDDDIGFTPEAFHALLSHDVDVVAAAPQRRDTTGKVKFCAHVAPDHKTLTVENHLGKYPLLTGHGATAFMRIKRHVFERLQDKVDWYTHESTGNDKVRAYFDYKIGPCPSGAEKSYNGEDYYFCQLCQDNNIDVWIDTVIPLDHWNMMPMREIMANHIFEELQVEKSNER